MKNLFPICLALAAAGCAAMDEPAPGGGEPGEGRPVMIDLQTGFGGEWVEVKVNQEPIFAGVVTTDDRIGLAGTLRHNPAHKSELDLVVTINRAQRFPFHIQLSKGRYLGLERGLDDRIVRLFQQDRPFLYD